MSGYIVREAPGWPMHLAYDARDAAAEVREHVLSQQVDAIDRANSLRDKAADTLEKLARSAPRLVMDRVGITIPDNPPAPTSGTIDGTFDDPNLGCITPPGSSTHTIGEIPDIPEPKFQEFEPDFDHIAIPEAPQPGTFHFPDEPTLRGVELPDRRVLTLPTVPSIEELRLPALVFSPLAPFDDENPEFVGSSVSPVLQWAERPYEPVLMDEQVAVIRRMWAGGTGLPPAVEQALWERAASREDLAVSRDVSAAAVEFSSRGFTLPTGALVARIDAVRAEGSLRKQGLAREILIKVTDTQIENLRFACTQAVAAENLLIGLWNQMAQRGLEFARHQLDAELSTLNANIAVYNARQNARSMSANVRKMELEERTLELQRMRLELDGELARGQINEQKVRVYAEQCRAVLAEAELYKTEMQGAQIESDLERSEIEKYKIGVQATAEKIQADKLRFDVFESQVKGEIAKAQLVESQTRAFSAYVSGKAAINEVAIKNQAARISEEELRLRVFLGNLERDKAVIQAESSAISAAAEAHRVSTSRVVAEAQVKTSTAELEYKKWEAHIRTNLARAEVEIRKILADMEQMIRVANLQADILKAVGQGQATLAAGALAGVQIGASVDGRASISGDGGARHSTSLSMGGVEELP